MGYNVVWNGNEHVVLDLKTFGVVYYHFWSDNLDGTKCIETSSFSSTFNTFCPIQITEPYHCDSFSDEFGVKRLQI